MTPRVHRFESTGDAYDSSQTGYFDPEVPLDPDDYDKGLIEVADGDVLVVESEKAVAVMVEAWPVAISDERAGENFHRYDETFEWTRVPPVGGGEPKDYSESARVAQEEAAKL